MHELPAGCLHRPVHSLIAGGREVYATGALHYTTKYYSAIFSSVHLTTYGSAVSVFKRLRAAY